MRETVEQPGTASEARAAMAVPRSAAGVGGVAANGGRGAAPAPAAAGGQQLRFEGLEAYRGLAAILLVLFHTYQYARLPGSVGGYLYEGTPLHIIFRNLQLSGWFFLLSGFLVFLPFARAAIEQNRRYSSRGFLIRRALRLLPTYYVAIILVWTWRFSGSGEEWRDLFQHLTFTHIFDQKRIFWTIGPAWTLAVEVYFCVFMALAGPLMYIACGRIRRRGQRVVLLSTSTVVIFTGSVAYKWWEYFVARTPRDDWPVYFGLVAKADTLAIGMLLAVIVAATAGRVRFGGGLRAGLLVGGFAMMALFFIKRDSNHLIDIYFHTFSGLAFLLILSATVFAPPQTGWERFLNFAPWQFLGTISYSIYLWHEPILIELGKRNILIRHTSDAFPWNAGVIVTLAILAGAASYWGLERPTMLLRYLFTREGKRAPQYPEERPGLRGEER